MTGQFRVFDVKENKYPEDQEEFLLNRYGDLLIFDTSDELNELCDPDRYIVEPLYLHNKVICPKPVYVGDIVKATLPKCHYEAEPCIVTGRIAHDEFDGRFFIDERNPNKKVIEYGWDVHYIHDDMKVEVIGTVHDATELNTGENK